MSTEREIAEKFKEALETMKLDTIVPYMEEDMAYELLPSTFVVLQGGTPLILNPIRRIGRKLTKVEWVDMINGMFPMVQSVKVSTRS